MLTSRSPILDLLEPAEAEEHDSAKPDAVNAENAVSPSPGPVAPDAVSGDPYAENAENAVFPLPDRITAFRSFSASSSAKSRHLDEEQAENTVVVCYVCRGSDFWTGSGATVCRRCHPPAPGAERRPATTATQTDSVRGGAA